MSITPAQPLDGNGKPLAGPNTTINGASYPTQLTSPVDGQKATYAAGIIGLAPASSATDIFTINNLASPTKLIRVTRIRISGFKTTAGAAVDVQLLKRSTLNTSGTKTNPVATPYDSLSASATAVVTAYTVNPTLGTQVGTSAIIAADSIFVPLATASGSLLSHDFGNRPAQGIVLRASETLAVNLNGATVGGGSFDIWVEWTEE